MPVDDSERAAILHAIMAARADEQRLREREARDGPQDVHRLHAAMGALAIAVALGERRWSVLVLVRVAWWAGRVLGRSG